jgi:hypothetical protein
MIVRGVLSGKIRDFSITDSSRFIGQTLSFGALQNFHLGANATFHSPGPIKLEVNGTFENKSYLSSSKDVSLSVGDDVGDVGVIVAKNDIEILLKKQGQIQNRLNQAADVEKMYKSRLVSKRKITHVDKYLNTITDWYNVTKDRYGNEVSRVYSHTTETGYIFQGRETKVEDSKEAFPPELTQMLQDRDASVLSIHNAIEQLSAILSDTQKEIAKQTKEYNRALLKTILGNGGRAVDLSRFRRNQLIRALGEVGMAPGELEQVRRDYPSVDEWIDCANGARRLIAPMMQALDHPTVRIMNDVVIPAAIAALIIGSDIFSGGTTAPATAPVLVACYARLAPVIVRTATAIGAAEAYRATIDHTRATFSRSGGERGEGAGAGKGGGTGAGKGGTKAGKGGTGNTPKKTEPPKVERVIPTKEDQIAFTMEQKASGAWEGCKTGDWKGCFQSRDGTHRFVPTVEKWEYEVYKRIGKGWEHCGIMRAAGPEKGKILEKFAKGIIKK